MYRSGQIVEAKANNLRFLTHYGILIVEDGEIFIIHNTPFKNSVIELYRDWLKTRTVKTVYDSRLTQLSNNEILDRFDLVCKRDYDVFQYNCEHFANCMLNQNLESKQLEKFTLLAVLLLLFFKL